MSVNLFLERDSVLIMLKGVVWYKKFHNIGTEKFVQKYFTMLCSLVLIKDRNV